MQLFTESSWVCMGGPWMGRGDKDGVGGERMLHQGTHGHAGSVGQAALRKAKSPTGLPKDSRPGFRCAGSVPSDCQVT